MRDTSKNIPACIPLLAQHIRHISFNASRFKHSIIRLPYPQKKYSSQESQPWLATGGSISKLAVVVLSRKLTSLKETQRSKHLDSRKRHDSTGSLLGMHVSTTESTCLLKIRMCNSLAIGFVLSLLGSIVLFLGQLVVFAGMFFRIYVHLKF